MIRLNVFVQASKQNFAEAVEAAKQLTECSLKEEGNIAYDIFVSATRDDVFMICETWANKEVLEKHSNSEHFKKYVGRIQDLATMKLEQFEF